MSPLTHRSAQDVPSRAKDMACREHDRSKHKRAPTSQVASLQPDAVALLPPPLLNSKGRPMSDADSYRTMSIEQIKEKYNLQKFDVSFYDDHDVLTEALIKNFKYDSQNLLIAVGQLDAGLVLPLYNQEHPFYYDILATRQNPGRKMYTRGVMQYNGNWYRMMRECWFRSQGGTTIECYKPVFDASVYAPANFNITWGDSVAKSNLMPWSVGSRRMTGAAAQVGADEVRLLAEIDKTKLKSIPGTSQSIRGYQKLRQDHDDKWYRTLLWVKGPWAWGWVGNLPRMTSPSRYPDYEPWVFNIKGCGEDAPTRSSGFSTRTVGASPVKKRPRNPVSLEKSEKKIRRTWCTAKSTNVSSVEHDNVDDAVDSPPLENYLEVAEEDETMRIDDYGENVADNASSHGDASASKDRTYSDSDEIVDDFVDPGSLKLVPASDVGSDSVAQVIKVVDISELSFEKFLPSVKESQFAFPQTTSADTSTMYLSLSPPQLPSIYWESCEPINSAGASPENGDRVIMDVRVTTLPSSGFAQEVVNANGIHTIGSTRLPVTGNSTTTVPVYSERVAVVRDVGKGLASSLDFDVSAPDDEILRHVLEQSRPSYIPSREESLIRKRPDTAPSGLIPSLCEEAQQFSLISATGVKEMEAFMDSYSHLLGQFNSYTFARGKDYCFQLYLLYKAKTAKFSALFEQSQSNLELVSGQRVDLQKQLDEVLQNQGGHKDLASQMGTLQKELEDSKKAAAEAELARVAAVQARDVADNALAAATSKSLDLQAKLNTLTNKVDNLEGDLLKQQNLTTLAEGLASANGVRVKQVEEELTRVKEQAQKDAVDAARHVKERDAFLKAYYAEAAQKQINHILDAAGKHLGVKIHCTP